ncbi:MAG: TolC family protein [Polyangia bacterium]|jgi:cobalt-zinc-cadmium efflux system outer membrane protein
MPVFYRSLKGSAAALVAVVLLGPAISLADATAESPSLPPHLAMADALRLFRERGFDLIVADATVDSVRGDAQMAGAIPNPAISGGVGRSFGFNSATCPGCSALAWDVGVSDQSALFDTLSGKRGLRSRTAELALAVARQGRADTQRTLESMLRQQYLQAVYARDALDLTLESQSRLGHVLELNQARFQHGAISQVDALKVETEKLEADQEVERAEFDLAEAKFQLAFLLGVRGRMPDFEVDADLPRYRVPAELGRATVESLLDLARKQRPDLAAAHLQHDRAGTAVQSAKRLRFPDVALSLDLSGQGAGSDVSSPPTVSLGLTLTPPLFYRFQGEVQKAQADLRIQDTLLAKTEAQIVNDVTVALTQFKSTQRRVERAENGLLDRARRTRDLVQVQYEKGAASLLEYLDAQRMLIETTQGYLRDLADYWLAVVLIGEAVGLELGP